MSFQPDSFYYKGELLRIPIDKGEPIDRWLERVAFVLDLYKGGYDIEDLISLSRYHSNRVALGVSYSGRYR